MNNKEKKQHKESIIGKIIYGFLMFSPLLAILVTSLYVVINPNAKDSYYGENINNTQYERITNLDNLIVGNDYIMVPQPVSNETMTVGENRIKVEYLTVIGGSQQDYSNVKQFAIFTNNQAYTQFYFYDVNGSYLFNQNGSNIQQINFQYSSYSQQDNKLSNTIFNYQILFKVTYVKYSYLDNAFYYSLDSVENSQYFGWSKNTAIYSVLNTTCNGIGITTTFIPFILTYWLIISLIYLIYDLVLVFIHIAHNKVHELEEF